MCSSSSPSSSSSSSFLVSATRTIALTASLLLLLQPSRAQSRIVHVRYGYFSETRPFLAACARGWLDLYDSDTDTDYKVGCYPQSSGNFVASRLDNLQLDVAHIGSTPWAQAVARGVDAKEIYTSHYMGESQGIYVRPTHDNYSGIVTPYDLRDRRVGVPFGSTTHYQLLFLIELLGLKGSVTIVNMSPRGKTMTPSCSTYHSPIICLLTLVTILAFRNCGSLG